MWIVESFKVVQPPVSAAGLIHQQKTISWFAYDKRFESLVNYHHRMVSIRGALRQ